MLKCKHASFNKKATEPAKWNSTLVTICVAFLFTGCGGGSSSSNTRPTITPMPEERLLVSSLELADPILKSCFVDQAAEQSWVYADEIESVRCSSEAVDSLEGMEVFLDLPEVSLREIHLFFNTIDIEPLSNLKTLTNLSLGGLIIDNIDQLRTLTQLESLRFSGMPNYDGVNCNSRSGIESFGAVANLTNLRILRLSGCFAIDADYNAIGELENLEHLIISDNLWITELPPLKSMTKLQSLSLSGSPRISNIEVLRDVPELIALSLDGRVISNNHTVLSALTKLKSLAIDDSYLPDLNPLENMLELESIIFGWAELDFNPKGNVSDLTPLANLTKLRVLRLLHQSITDLTPLVGQTQLTEINLIDNNITDITMLRDMANLRELYLNENSIEFLPNLGNLNVLESLSLNRNRIVDISALSSLETLTRLELDNNKIVDLSPLMGLDQVTLLSLDRNQFIELDPLMEMMGLERLSLLNNIFPCSERDDFIAARPAIEVEWGSRCL